MALRNCLFIISPAILAGCTLAALHSFLSSSSLIWHRSAWSEQFFSMKNWQFCVVLSTALLAAFPVMEALPAPRFRMCGAHLASFLSLVCGSRGYFSPFNGSRDKRSPGIVEECCKASCTIRTWQQYCAEPISQSPEITTTEEPSQVIKAEGEVISKPKKGVRSRKGKGHGHRPSANGCSCRRRRKNILRKRLRDALLLNPNRVFQIGTITPYYESNQVISPIDESNNILIPPQ